jgi:hypothetical protein
MYRDIEEIKSANKAAGGNWFSPDTMAWFDGRVYPGVYGGRYFVSSEQDSHGAWDGQRLYTVRECDEDGDVHTAPGCTFGEYASEHGAREAARKLAGE